MYTDATRAVPLSSVPTEIPGERRVRAGTQRDEWLVGSTYASIPDAAK
jgi:hypothetical protein